MKKTLIALIIVIFAPLVLQADSTETEEAKRERLRELEKRIQQIIGRERSRLEAESQNDDQEVKVETAQELSCDNCGSTTCCALNMGDSASVPEERVTVGMNGGRVEMLATVLSSQVEGSVYILEDDLRISIIAENEPIEKLLKGIALNHDLEYWKDGQDYYVGSEEKKNKLLGTSPLIERTYAVDDSLRADVIESMLNYSTDDGTVEAFADGIHVKDTDRAVAQMQVVYDLLVQNRKTTD